MIAACTPVSELALAFRDAGLPNVFLSLAFVAVVLAVPAALLVRFAYLRGVGQLMKFRVINGERDDIPSAAVPKRSIEPAVHQSQDDLRSAGEQRRRRVKIASLAAYAAYIVAAVPATIVLGAEAGEEVLALPFLATGIAAIPLCLNLAPHRIGTLAAALSATLIAGVTATSYVEGDPDFWLNVVIAVVLAAAFFVLTGSRTLRRVAMPLSAVLLAGAVAFVAAVLIGDSFCSMAADVSTFTNALVRLATGLTGLLLVTASALAGIGVVAAAGRLQERGVASDLSLTAAFTLAMLTLLVASGGIEDIGVPGTLALAASWFTAAVTAYAWAIRTAPPEGDPAASLLVLRLFGRRAAASLLLDDIATRWRYFGAVHQVAGADLGGSTIDFYGLVKLLTYRLQHLFLIDPDARLASRVAREGRFPVRDLFCFDSTWMRVVDRLIAESPTILLDVRGFDGRQRGGQGLAAEIVLLCQHDALRRTVALRDERTEWPIVQQLVEQHGGRIELLTSVTVGGRQTAADCVNHLLSVSRP